MPLWKVQGLYIIEFRKKFVTTIPVLLSIIIHSRICAQSFVFGPPHWSLGWCNITPQGVMGYLLVYTIAKPSKELSWQHGVVL